MRSGKWFQHHQRCGSSPVPSLPARLSPYDGAPSPNHSPPTPLPNWLRTDALLSGSLVVVVERLPHAHENHPSDFTRVVDALEETLR